MIQIITKEWEITKTYIFEVALKDAPICLDWNDFETSAIGQKVAVCVKCDEPMAVRELVTTALDEVNKNLTGVLASLMVIISYKPDEDLMMEEVCGLNECFNTLGEKDVNVIWGVQPDSDIENKRSMLLFAFEKQ